MSEVPRWCGRGWVVRFAAKVPRGMGAEPLSCPLAPPPPSPKAPCGPTLERGRQPISTTSWAIARWCSRPRSRGRVPPVTEQCARPRPFIYSILSRFYIDATIGCAGKQPPHIQPRRGPLLSRGARAMGATWATHDARGCLGPPRLPTYGRAALTQTPFQEGSGWMVTVGPHDPDKGDCGHRSSSTFHLSCSGWELATRACVPPVTVQGSAAHGRPRCRRARPGQPADHECSGRRSLGVARWWKRGREGGLVQGHAGLRRLQPLCSCLLYLFCATRGSYPYRARPLDHESLEQGAAGLTSVAGTVAMRGGCSPARPRPLFWPFCSLGSRHQRQSPLLLRAANALTSEAIGA